ncbi:MAG TPA: hypothetical protein VGO68_22430 [Pyrinomonadaceae bacterium]|nr:hypothetical protein [Pyrinomonadaceae bacterium]
MHKPLHRLENTEIRFTLDLLMGSVQNASEFKKHEQIVGNNFTGAYRANDFSDSRRNDSTNK